VLSKSAKRKFHEKREAIRSNLGGVGQWAEVVWDSQAVACFLFFGGGFRQKSADSQVRFDPQNDALLGLSDAVDASVKRGHYTKNNEPCIFGNIPQDPHETNSSRLKIDCIPK